MLDQDAAALLILEHITDTAEAGGCVRRCLLGSHDQELERHLSALNSCAPCASASRAAEQGAQTCRRVPVGEHLFASFLVDGSRRR
jgi:hypothetical protein